MDSQAILSEAQAAYERAVFGGEADDVGSAERALDAVEGQVLLARGRLRHTRLLADRRPDPIELDQFVRAAELFASAGDARGEAEALFWQATYHQVTAEDHATAAPFLDRAETLARATGDDLTLSYVLRHRSFVAQADDDLGLAESLMQESTRLRRELGFAAGVAANLIGLAYLASVADRSDDAIDYLDEADDLARSVGAHGVRGWIHDARAEIEPRP